MGVAPISGLWKKRFSLFRNKKADGLELMVVSGLGRAGGEGARDGWNSRVCNCRRTWLIGGGLRVWLAGLDRWRYSHLVSVQEASVSLGSQVSWMLGSRRSLCGFWSCV